MEVKKSALQITGEAGIGGSTFRRQMHRRGMISMEDYFHSERVDLDKVNFTPELVASLAGHLARHYRVLPITASEWCMQIALADPSDLDTIDALHHILKCEIEPVVADERQLNSYLQKLYGDPAP